MGVEEGLKFVESLGGIETIIVTNSKEVYITKGLKNNFEIPDKEFMLKN